MAATIRIIILYYLQLTFSWAQDLGGPLYLTPLLKSGKFEEARKLAEVQNLPPDVKSYSGLVTVDKTNGVHSFFWFFPAANNPETAPLVLWSEGGPGLTCLLTIFVGNGPFVVNKNGTLQYRETTWTKNYSVIYVDQPAGVGYSLAEKEEGHVTSATAAAPYMYEFLMQFFTMFPEFKENDFINGGGSYGGMYAPTFAHYIHRRNMENPAVKIKLKGVYLDSPWFDPVNQINYGEQLYHSGLIDSNARSHFKKEADKMKSLISEGKYTEAQEINAQLIWGSVGETYYARVTGLGTLYNILNTKFDIDLVGASIMGESPTFRKAIHVGDLRFNLLSTKVMQMFQPSILKSTAPMVEELLNFGYKFLIAAAQLDIITSQVGIDTAVEKLHWKGSKSYRDAPREIWKVGDNVVAYIKSTPGLTYVMVRNSGHGVGIDHSEIALELIDRLATDVKKVAIAHQNCSDDLLDGSCQANSGAS